MIYIAS